MALTSQQRRYLKGLAHKLQPKVHLGKHGFSQALQKEIDRQLADWELIKVRVGVEGREEFLELADTISQTSKSHMVQAIGRIIVLYREGEEPEIKLPRS
jgi:RNA-binding protein